MTGNEVEAIVEKYRKMSNNLSFFGEDKCVFFEQIADYISDNKYSYVDDDFFESEQDIIEAIKSDFDQQDHIFDREDYINMGLLDESYDE